MCMNALTTFMYVYHKWAWLLWRSEEAIGYPGTGLRMVMSCHAGTVN